MPATRGTASRDFQKGQTLRTKAKSAIAITKRVLSKQPCTFWLWGWSRLNLPECARGSATLVRTSASTISRQRANSEHQTSGCSLATAAGNSRASIGRHAEGYLVDP